MGSMLAPGRLIKNTIPKIIDILKEDKVDIACSVISIIDKTTNQLKIPRFYSVPYSLGFPLGSPVDFNNQKQICKKTLELIY